MSPQEIEAAIVEIRDRVQERYRKTVEDLDDFELPSLDPLGHARDAAEGKAAAIGRVNPRPGGLVNNAIQYAKRLAARCLNWFVRDQIDYNRAVVTYMERVIETLIEQNHTLLRVARGLVDTQRAVAEINEAQRDILNHWHNWRPEWEKRLTDSKSKFSHMIREVESAARRREEAAQADAAKMRREFTEINEAQRDILNHWHNWRPEWEKRLTDSESKFSHAIREVESAARRREEAAQADAAKMRREFTEINEAQRDILNHWHNWRPEWEKRLTDSESKFSHAIREVESAARRREEAAQADDAKMRREFTEINEAQRDILNHWHNWRPEWEKRLTDSESKFSHAIREVESAARRREEAAQVDGAKMHEEYSALLSQSVDALQQQFWADMAKQRTEQEKSIHTELRLIRRRSRVETATAAPAPAPAVDKTAALPHRLDYGRFQERFRGSEEYVAKTQAQYLEICRGLAPVADIGCGRGELLELFQAEDVECLGVDSDPDAISACLDKGLNVEAGDLFMFLHRQKAGTLGAIVSAHVVEHLPPLRLPEFVEIAAAKLKPGGILAIETPNPACLAIFTGDFYLDPTHRRPTPAQQLRFYMEESGLGEIDVRELNPAYELIPELAEFREDPSAGPFVKKFFGGLDYVILGKKL